MNLFDSIVAGKLAGGGSGGGGVSSWNDLTDKPFGMVDDAVLLPPTQFEYDDYFGLFAVPGYIDFIEGNTYTVNWNGVEYTTTAVPGQFDGENLIVIGNPAALGGANNNLPFAIACLLGSIGAIPLDGSTAVNVSIKGYGVRRISEEYMPVPYRGGMLFETIPAEGSNLNGDEIDLVSYTQGVTNNDVIEAIKAGVYVCMRVKLAEYMWFDLNPCGGFDSPDPTFTSNYRFTLADISADGSISVMSAKLTAEEIKLRMAEFSPSQS